MTHGWRKRKPFIPGAMWAREQEQHEQRELLTRGWFFRVIVWPWGQVNFKPVADSLFSERYCKVPTCVLFGVRITWRRWRKL